MVLGRIRGWFGGSGGGADGAASTELPQYFPVVPKGCEAKSEALFKCIAGRATDRLRAIEEAGDVLAAGGQRRRRQQPLEKDGEVTANGEGMGGGTSSASGSASESLAGEDPLDACRDLIAQYRRCCDRQLKRKKNWMLTETYRVQEEYRYDPSSGQGKEED